MKPWINCEVYEVIKETHDTVTLRLTLESPMPFFAGQFVMVRFAEGELQDDKRASRAFSISSSTDNPSIIDITIREYKDGKISPKLCNCNKGDKLKVRGPYGNFIYKQEYDENLVLIGAGSGIAPLMSIFATALGEDPNKDITLIYSDKTERDLIRKNWFMSYKDFPRVDLCFTTTRMNWLGRQGRIDKKLIDLYVPYKEENLFYICGSPSFVNDMVNILKELNVELSKIKTEKYD